MENRKDLEREIMAIGDSISTLLDEAKKDPNYRGLFSPIPETSKNIQIAIESLQSQKDSLLEKLNGKRVLKTLKHA